MAKSFLIIKIATKGLMPTFSTTFQIAMRRSRNTIVFILAVTWSFLHVDGRPSTSTVEESFLNPPYYSLICVIISIKSSLNDLNLAVSQFLAKLDALAMKN